MKSKMKSLNPNKYTLASKGTMSRVKSIKYRKWLGTDKTKELDGLEGRFWKYYRDWWAKDLLDTSSLLHMGNMAKYFK